MKRILLSAFTIALTLILCAGFSSPAMAAGEAPVAENLELSTYKNVSVSGQLSAFDADDDVVDYEITTQPVKGYIELAKDGSFVYTPGEGKKGKDYFGYKAIDAEGNYSQEATVIIKIEKQKKNVSYTDMKGTAGEYSAIVLSEAGIFTGEQIGDEYCFYPDRAVSRGEFLSMCMLAADKPVITGVVRTGYTDDEDIPDWMKPYVVTTVMNGSADSYNSFLPNEDITKAEAVMMLNSILGMNDVNYIDLDETLEPEIAQACANLSASGLIGESIAIQETMSRVEAAELLSKALEIMSKR
jgi:hypothetical protein